MILCPVKRPIQNEAKGASLVVQWVRLHTPNAGDPGLIPAWGTRSRMHTATKSSKATTKKSACLNEDPVCSS